MASNSIESFLEDSVEAILGCSLSHFNVDELEPLLEIFAYSLWSKDTLTQCFYNTDADQAIDEDIADGVIYKTLTRFKQLQIDRAIVDELILREPKEQISVNEVE